MHRGFGIFNANNLTNYWNVAVRMVFNLDMRTHKYLIEEISNQNHLQTSLFWRYFSFRKQLSESPKFVIRYLFRITENDNRTVKGQNMSYIQSKCGNIKIHHKKDIKRNCKFAEIPEEQLWRVPIFNEIVSSFSENNSHKINGFSDKELKDILKFICSS